MYSSRQRRGEAWRGIKQHDWLDMLRSYTHAFEFPGTQRFGKSNPQKAHPAPIWCPTQLPTRLTDPNRISAGVAGLRCRTTTPHCAPRCRPCQRCTKAAGARLLPAAAARFTAWLRSAPSAEQRQRRLGRSSMHGQLRVQPQPKGCSAVGGAGFAEEVRLDCEDAAAGRSMGRGGSRCQEWGWQTVRCHRQAVAAPPRAACRPGLG